MACSRVYMLHARQIDTPCACATGFSEWITKSADGRARTWLVIVHPHSVNMYSSSCLTFR